MHKSCNIRQACRELDQDILPIHPLDVAQQVNQNDHRHGDQWLLIIRGRSCIVSLQTRTAHSHYVFRIEARLFLNCITTQNPISTSCNHCLTDRSFGLVYFFKLIRYIIINHQYSLIRVFITSSSSLSSVLLKESSIMLPSAYSLVLFPPKMISLSLAEQQLAPYRNYKNCVVIGVSHYLDSVLKRKMSL